MNTSQIIEQIQTVMKRSNPNLVGYILSVDEKKALPKLNSWEREFLTNIRCGLEHETIKQLSPKQMECLNKIFSKVG